MSTITSILGTDLISASRTTINNNFASLNDGKYETTNPEVNIGFGVVVAQSAGGLELQTLGSLGSDGQVLTSQGAGVFPEWTDVIPTIRSWVTEPMAPMSQDSIGNAANVTSTTMRLHMFNLPAKLVVGMIVVQVGTVGVAGTLDISIYSEDGQTRPISITTTNITGSGELQLSLTPVTLSPGNYYFAMNANSTADINTSGRVIANTVISNPSLKPVLAGTLTITADTPPATINPAAITFAAAAYTLANLMT